MSKETRSRLWWTNSAIAMAAIVCVLLKLLRPTSQIILWMRFLLDFLPATLIHSIGIQSPLVELGGDAPMLTAFGVLVFYGGLALIAWLGAWVSLQLHKRH